MKKVTEMTNEWSKRRASKVGKVGQLAAKLATLLVAVALVFALTGCSYSTHRFLDEGWDYEAKGVSYEAGTETGLKAGTVTDEDEAAASGVYISEDGSAGVRSYSLKGPAADGTTIDVSAN